MARQYIHVMTMEEETIKFRKEGKTRQEIADILGLSKIQVKNWINRYNKRQIKVITIPKRKGRPRKYPMTKQHEMALRIKELEREVSLYKSFLHAAGRR